MLRNLALFIVLAATSLAHANGRAPATSTINFRQGNQQDIVAGMTFGVVISHDNGVTWQWMCEKAVLYGGMYDPDYVYAPSGALFATTFEGSLVNRDGCTFAPTTFQKKFFSTITQSSTGALYMAAADAENLAMGNPGDAKIYKSTDDGLTFPTVTTAGILGDWYNSIEVAPSDPNRLYLSGYRLPGGIREFQLYRSDNAGTSFQPINASQFTTSNNSTIDIVGIKANQPNTVFARVQLQGTSIGDAIWRSVDGGANWTKIFEKNDTISFLARANGDLVAATPNSGTFVSRGPNNTTWEPVATAPHINCLAENTAGELWACTQNFGAMQTPSDDAGIMKTTDLVTWTKVLRFQDIAGPVACAPGTRQHDQCIYDCPDLTYNDNPATCPNVSPASWCILKNQLGITSTAIVCPAVFDGPPDDVGDVTKKPEPGCCESGDTSGGPAALALSLVIGTVVLRSRRRKVT
jgi:uncharacterized protein (TIGR03382 family)